MNKLSVVLAFSLNSNCSGLRMLWIWIYLFNLDCKVDMNNILFAQTTCQSDSSVICWGPSITFLLVIGFITPIFQSVGNLRLKIFSYEGSKKYYCPCLIISFRNYYRIQVAFFLS